MSPRRTGIPDRFACDKQVVANSHEIDIQWGARRDAAFPPDSRLKAWAEAALDHLAAPPSQLCVRFMDSAEIAELNRRYRHKEGPTNVLSFPGTGQDESGHVLLGDIAICTEIIQREAGEQARTLAAHTAHMLVHGILHLEGFDHEDDEGARKMEREEAAILASFGFDNPYENPAGEGDHDHE